MIKQSVEGKNVEIGEERQIGSARVDLARKEVSLRENYEKSSQSIQADRPIGVAIFDQIKNINVSSSNFNSRISND